VGEDELQSVRASDGFVMVAFEAGARQRVRAPESFHSEVGELSRAFHVNWLGTMPPGGHVQADRVTEGAGPDVIAVRGQGVEIRIGGREEQIAMTRSGGIVVARNAHTS